VFLLAREKEVRNDVKGIPICPICDHPHIQVVLHFKGYFVNRCQACGVQFLFPPPEEEVLSSIYSNNYFLGEKIAEDEARVNSLKKGTASLYLERMEEYMPKERRDLLEIGCGRGDFLIEAQTRGFRVNGLEISGHAVEIANKKIGSRKVRQGCLEESSFPGELFDTVVFFDVLEHIRDPLRFLKICNQKMKTGGTIAFVTPSLDNFLARWMGRYWMEYKVEHLFYFTQASVKRALNRAGFTNIAIRQNRKMLSFYYLWQHFQRYRVPVLSFAFDHLRKCIPSSIVNWPMKLVDSNMVIIAEKSTNA
jgi:2-polyprenyl-3-methyl-5-hydroxy-6-metoxy-1,4-benzoquinol methylase